MLGLKTHWEEQWIGLEDPELKVGGKPECYLVSGLRIQGGGDGLD